MTQKSFSMYKIDRCDKMRRRNDILPPSEGVQKSQENASPSEGGTWSFPRRSVLQALYGQCRIFPPTEGVQKRHGNASPSEGGTWPFPRISVLQALYGQCRIFPPSEGVQKNHENASPSEGGQRRSISIEFRNGGLGAGGLQDGGQALDDVGVL